MKTIALLLALASLPAHASLVGSPYLPEMDSRFNALELGTGLATGAVTTAKILDGTILEADISPASVSGLGLSRIAKVTYDVAVSGGSSGAHILAVTLPAKSVIERSWFYVDTQFTGSSTVQLFCETGNNIFSAADITGKAAASLTEGVSTGTAANMKQITSACAVTASVVGTASAGKLTMWLKYFVHD